MLRGVDPLSHRFEVVARHRPVDLLRPLPEPPPGSPSAWVAPYATVTGDPTARLVLAAGDVVLSGRYDGAASLEVSIGGRTARHRNRRHGTPHAPVEAPALTLTGTQLTVLTRESDRWVARGRVDLEGRVDTHDEDWLADLAVDGGRAGAFGQLGLRDVRLVTHADGTPYRLGRLLLLTATSAGPGFFATAHTSVWSLDADSLELTHRADLFFRRPDRPGVLGDHATHLLRDGDRWLVATSTWGDFDKRRAMRVTLAETTADLLTGRHVLDTRPLPLPTGGLRSVGVWDPHLVRTDDGWLVGFVNAERYFRFHPALAGGPTLEDLRLLGADLRLRAAEGTTLLPTRQGWRVLASDSRGRFPVYDTAMTEVGTLDAPYPTNIPWPTLVPDGPGWLLLTFNGTGYGGRLAGRGTAGHRGSTGG